jgi:hypothetical protein
MTNQNLHIPEVNAKKIKEGKDAVQHSSRPFMTRSKKLTKEEKEVIAKDLKVKRDKERTPVRGIFKYHECPGAMFEFMFKKYAEDPLEKFSMLDGEVYTIPLGVARHLNTACWYPVHKFQSKDSSLTTQEKIRRTSFQSLEFMDEALAA